MSPIAGPPDPKSHRPFFASAWPPKNSPIGISKTAAIARLGWPISSQSNLARTLYRGLRRALDRIILRH
jgi:hypothetical protein